MGIYLHLFWGEAVIISAYNNILGQVSCNYIHGMSLAMGPLVEAAEIIFFSSNSNSII